MRHINTQKYSKFKIIWKTKLFLRVSIDAEYLNDYPKIEVQNHCYYYWRIFIGWGHKVMLGHILGWIASRQAHKLQWSLQIQKSIYLKSSSMTIRAKNALPAMFKINFRVMKKNSLPDNATLLLTTSSKNRFASGFHWQDGTERNIFNGFLDSSLTWAANNETANVRMITKIHEKMFCL